MPSGNTISPNDSVEPATSLIFVKKKFAYLS
jgi:hypothetical protein